MNSDIIKGKWQQLRGQAKVMWGQLTDDELEQVEGQTDKLIGLVQERYGYTRQRARFEVGAFLKRLTID